MSLEGKVAIVTGGGRGLGRAMVLGLAAAGARVVTTASREATEVEAVAREAGDDRVAPMLADVSREEDCARVVAMALDRFGRLDMLVNNAGVSTLGPVASADPEAEMNMIEVDVVSVADLCTRFLPGMTARRRGVVLNVASTAAFQPLPGQAGYGASKAFVLSYSQSLAGELHGSGVTVTALCPGPVQTEFGEAAGFADGDAEAALPSIMWVPAEDVAKTAVDAMAKGQMVAIPGIANRVGSVFASLTPRSLLVPILARVHPGLKK